MKVGILKKTFKMYASIYLYYLCYVEGLFSKHLVFYTYSCKFFSVDSVTRALYFYSEEIVKLLKK